METHGSQRRLAAILMADVVGYSRLMGQDEEATVSTLASYRDVFTSYIPKYNGRVVDAKGDALMAEFGSVVDAVNCSVEIQRELAEKNAELPSHRRMDFRIGINLGDVIVKGEEIYGDGINVAARLESLAEPGGICISGKVHAEVESRLHFSYEFIGEQSVKNIAKPVPAYKVLSQPGAAAHRVVRVKRAMGRLWRKWALVSAAVVILAGAGLAAWYLYFGPGQEVAEEGLALPDKPSIAVLPFVNMSGDPEQEYFADGMTDNIITDLSKLRNLFVIARNSAFTYKGKAVDVRQVGRELGVRYVLEGGIQKILQQIRINVQLVDTVTGDHLWAERYDREYKDIFDLQDEITRKIVTELDVALVEGEQARVWRRATNNTEAYDYFLRGQEAFLRLTKEDNALARELLQKAIDLDPDFATAMAQMAFIHFFDAVNGWSESPASSWEQVFSRTKRALKLDDDLDYAVRMLGVYYLFHDGDHEQALENIKRAVALNPNGAENVMFHAVVLNRMGDAQGLEIAKKAMRLNPNPPVWYLSIFGGAYWLAGRHEEAIATLTRCTDQVPDYIFCRVKLVLALVEVGREEEGMVQAKEVLRINPRFSSAGFADDYTSPTKERVAALLQRAGLP